MRRILLTGISGTGKSTALSELQKLGLAVLDTDEAGWTEWSSEEDGYVWREDRIEEFLTREIAPVVYVSGPVSNQGRFYRSFDAIVLLSAPEEVVLSRIEARTNNPYGKSHGERARIVRELAEVEPMLRAGATHEIDATQPVSEVVRRLVEIGTAVEPGPGRGDARSAPG